MPKKLFMFFIMVVLSACASGLTEPAEPAPTSSPTILPTAMATSNSPTWAIMDHWTSANQIRALLVDRSGDLWTGGPGGIVHWDLAAGTPTIYALSKNPEKTNVIALSQAPDGTIWAGTFGNGVASFDGTNWHTFTMENGLPANHVVSQTITPDGKLWFSIRKDEYSMEGHFGRLDENIWIAEAGGSFDHIVAIPDGSIVGTYNFSYSSGFFPSTIGIYDGQVWNETDVVTDNWIGAVTVAPDGVIWFATRDTIYRFANHTWQTMKAPWTGQGFPQVSSIAVSKENVAWFGFSLSRLSIDPCGTLYEDFTEKGVYRYDGKNWSQFTTQDGLVDNKICAITVDNNGGVWFGSFDKGVSYFDGSSWKTYQVP